MNNAQALTVTLLSLFVLNACKSTPESPFKPEKSYLGSVLATTDVDNKNKNGVKIKPTTRQQAKVESIEYIDAFKVEQQRAKVTDDIVNKFSESKEYTLTADSLTLADFLHQMLGEQLKISYILSDDIKNSDETVTLNIQQAITERKLFLLVDELLVERGYTIRFNDNIFYVHKSDNTGQSNLTYGYGNSIDDVPTTTGNIVQMVPFEYGMIISMSNTLRQMIGVKSSSDPARNSINVFGKRNEIIRALELIELFDRPQISNRHIGMFKSTFVDGAQLLKKLTEVLKQEGIKLGKANETSSTISAVNLDKQGKIIFFASKKSVIERAVYWAKQIDKPVKMAEKQYFIYTPQYSRALDMGESLEALIGEVGALGNNTSAAAENKAGNSRRSRGARSASGDDIKLVIDERSNLVIFFTTAEKYQQILPLIKRLDILPKQIMLEVIIAEVSLTDEFKQGVEFAFNNGNYGFSTNGAFMGEGFGGLSYLLKGANGQIAVNLLQTNSLVNILSRPSLVVRDGVNASISVGTDIPIVGETSQDPINGEKQTTKIIYRKTGVDLSVTPTVNAQGVVLMEISQKISNQLETGSTLAGNPSVFERTIDTEVIAESGQTIILGGLISENQSTKDSRVPFFSDLPIIGSLFGAETQSGDKTELVIMITPRVIESADEWGDLITLFDNTLTELTITNKK